MKLYATVTSERASKGQGGNERIVIHVTGADRKNDIAVFVIWPWRNNLEDGLEHISANIREDITMTVEKFAKGEMKGHLSMDCIDNNCTSCLKEHKGEKQSYAQRIAELEKEGLTTSDAQGVADIEKQDIRYCHLCGSKEIKGGWCTNNSCSEYRRNEEKGEKQKGENCQECGGGKGHTFSPFGSPVFSNVL